VYLVRERFGYYHVGLFLLDERRENAVLVAATGDAGKRMLARGHRLRVGETGMVGYVARSGHARVAADVTRDSTHYLNPDLPDTRAETALPLKSGMQVIGILDVQSTREAAFTEDMLEVLQVVADQFAVAIESARLLRQTRATLKQLEVVSGSYTREAWRTAQQRLGGVVGYRYRGLRTDPIDERIQATSGLVEKHIIPLRLRDEVIGEVELHFAEPPDKETLSVFDEISSRLALLLENARLVQEAQNLAAREQRINLITNQVRSSLNLDSILRSTVKELGAAFGASRAFVQINPTYRQEVVGVPDNGNSGSDGSEEDHAASTGVEDNL
jgi:GAF domain-containing protein